MGVLSALGRWLKALGYLLTGRIDNARKAIDANPNVMNAKYDEMGRRLSEQINEFVNAAAKVSAHVAKKKANLLSTDEEIAKLQKLQAGALNMGKRVAEELQSKGEDPTNHVEYTTHRSAYNDFSSTLLEKLKMKTELEDAIKSGELTSKNHLSTLKNLKRQYEDLKKEQGEMVARMITSQQERELNESISGLDADTGKIQSERSSIRAMVMESEAAAKITGKLAGTDARRVEEEYMEQAVSSAANSEFDNFTGIAPKATNALPEKTDTINLGSGVSIKETDYSKHA